MKLFDFESKVHFYEMLAFINGYYLCQEINYELVIVN